MVSFLLCIIEATVSMQRNNSAMARYLNGNSSTGLKHENLKLLKIYKSMCYVLTQKGIIEHHESVQLLGQT